MTYLPSIQGESIQDNGRAIATWEDVEAYIDSVSEDVLRCRVGLHTWPDLVGKQVGIEIVFTEVDANDFFLRRLKCRCCGLAWRTETWGYNGRGGNVRFELLDANVTYKDNKRERYTSPPGVGFIPKKLMREVLMTRAMRGQSPAALKKALKREKRAGRKK